MLKLAANHMLSAEMKLTPLQTSETAWCWFALDIAEGEPRHEHFAIKFKVLCFILFIFFTELQK